MFYVIVTIYITATTITGRDVKDWSLDFFLSQLLTKISVSVYEKGRQFSCHLITGSNVKDFSLVNVLPQIVYCTKISVSSYYNGWQVCCHLIWFKFTNLFY